jgi:hypothetical protein
MLVPLPKGVATEIRPEVAPVGTAVAIVVVVEEVTAACMTLNLTSLLAGTASKFVPVMVTAVPGVPVVGVKFVIVGAPLLAVTVKAVGLVAELVTLMTLIGPVVAPEGTVVLISVPVADVTVARIPLKMTMFSVAVVLKPVP